MNKKIIFADIDGTLFDHETGENSGIRMRGAAAGQGERASHLSVYRAASS